MAPTHYVIKYESWLYVKYDYTLAEISMHVRTLSRDTVHGKLIWMRSFIVSYPSKCVGLLYLQNSLSCLEGFPDEDYMLYSQYQAYRRAREDSKEAMKSVAETTWRRSK